MCGIVGFSGRYNVRALSNAVQILSHRGPDDSGIYHDESARIGLGHTRLSIQDLSQMGHQPMLNESGTVALVFNGEIYNFHEVRDSLVKQGYSFRGHSDTEVLLKLYSRDGDDFIRGLNGIFALAVWNKYTKRLLLARDGLGVKPLYYSIGEAGVSFASEIKALLSFLDIKAVNAKAIHRYLNFLWCPGDETPLNKVRKLTPGTAMVIRYGNIERQWQWYRLPTFQGRHQKLNRKESIGGVESYLRQAVKRQMVADVKVGAFLSGGLDSSAIVAMAREHTSDISCFTINAIDGSESGEEKDLPYAQQVAQYLGVPLDVVDIESSRMADDIEQMVYTLDEPLADPASLNVLYISRLAREKGIKVLLSGAGGDDLFTGYRRHLAYSYERIWAWLPEGLRRFISSRVKSLDQRTTIGRRVNRLFAHAGESAQNRLLGYFSWAQESVVRSLYSHDFNEAVGQQSAYEPMKLFLNSLPKDTTALSKMLALEQRFFLTEHNLNYTDKMSMAAGVEVRVPYLDPDLVEFAAGIPDYYKQRGSVGKWVLKKAMEPYLPKKVIYRPKTGFGAPLRHWMRNELREILGDYLSAESLSSRGFFNPVVVQQLIKDNDAGRVDAAYLLLSLLCIEIWCRKFLDTAGNNSCM